MHIGFLTTEYPIETIKTGGIGVFVKHITHLLHLKGNTPVTVFLWGDQISEEITDEGVTIIPIPIQHHGKISFYTNRKNLEKKLNELIKFHRIDLIETIDWYGPLAFCNLHVPVVTRLHGSNVYFDYLTNKKTPWVIRLMERNALRASTAYIGVSRQALDLTQKLFRLQTHKLNRVIYNPIDSDYVSRFYNNKPVSDIVKIIYFGTIVEKKGVFDIPLIFNQISESNPNVQLILIGKETLSNGISTWELCKSYFSEDALRKAKYLGPLPYEETMKQLNEADICLFPNHAETFGLVLLEAMFMRKAIVCSDIDCFKEIVDNEINALQCPVGNISQFVRSLQLLITDSQIRDKLARNAYDKAQNTFNTDYIVKQNISFYKEVLQNYK